MPNYTNWKELMAQNFGEELTPAQLWALTKFAKNVRLRCRNNTAFNNMMNQAFPYARFEQVNKTRVNKYSGQNETYPGLQISIKGQIAENNDDDE